MAQRIVIYQALPRLFGNSIRTCQPGGDRNTNGCGKLADFSPLALRQIAALGATHVWYTGLLEHATGTDYSAYGIRGSHPGTVKGVAGSPYAVRDYYDIDPDLATSVPARMQEFHDLVRRTHDAGLGFIMDFIPNHVARDYHSDARPADAADFGSADDTALHFSPRNNFYYFPGQQLTADFDLQGYCELPARATGNDCFSPHAGRHDWYETVKLNYGVDYTGGRAEHFDPVPDTWKKMLHILLYWAAKGVDGFRCDMAEMVPVPFWRWAITQVKARYPRVFFLAEVYNPQLYRSYIHDGHFDYLYDKVGMYDTLRAVICGHASAADITRRWQEVDDIRHRMLYFLENHDEQRLASDFFAGDPLKGRPALLAMACMGQNPLLVYFGQELGERGMDCEGFSGRDGRTTIFDYWTVDCIRRWRNDDTFNDRQLSPAEVALQQFYSRVLTLCNHEDALREGEFYDLQYANLHNPGYCPARHYAFLRRLGGTVILVAVNFGDTDAQLDINIPEHVFQHFGLPPAPRIKGRGLLTSCPFHLTFCPQQPTRVTVPAHNGRVIKFELAEAAKQ